jgi:hypothetical protein
MKRISGHSKARFRQFPNSPCGLEQRKLLFFRFAKNGYRKFFTIRCRGVAVWTTVSLDLTPPFHFLSPVVHISGPYTTTATQVKLYFEIGLALQGFPVIA